MTDPPPSPGVPAPRRPFPYAHAPRLPERDRVDLAEIFATLTGPLAIEIGTGRGAFALEWLSARPSDRLLALEVRRKWATVLDDRFAARGWRDRARAFAEDAREALVRIAPAGAVDFVFLHFPDPWWKKRHQKRLVMGDALTTEIGRLLAPGGVLYLQTDVESRALEYESRLSSEPGLVPAGDVEGSPRMAHNPYGARSNREKRADEDGLPVWRLRYRRAASPAAPTPDAKT